MPSERFDDILSAARSQTNKEKIPEKVAQAKRGNPDYGNYSVLIPKSLRRKIKLIQAEFEDEAGEQLEYSEIVELLLTQFVQQCEVKGVQEGIKKLKGT